MPAIVKPASQTAYLTELVTRRIIETGILPEGALQLVIGGTGDLLNRLDVRDVVTFTGSADTAAKLRVTTVVGGVSKVNQVRQLRRGVGQEGLLARLLQAAPVAHAHHAMG